MVRLLPKCNAFSMALTTPKALNAVASESNATSNTHGASNAKSEIACAISPNLDFAPTTPRTRRPPSPLVDPTPMMTGLPLCSRGH